MTNNLFGSDGIFDQIEVYQKTRTLGDSALENQLILAPRLLETSQSLTEQTKEEIVATSKQANALVAQTRKVDERQLSRRTQDSRRRRAAS